MFTQDDFKFIADVFSLARLQTVNAQPSNRTQLENILKYELIVQAKFEAANKGLGYVEPEAKVDKDEADLTVVSEEKPDTTD